MLRLSSLAALSALMLLTSGRRPGLAEDAVDSPRATAAVHAEAADGRFNPCGRWVLTLPAGWQRKITIAPASDDTYFFRGVDALLLNGVYEMDVQSSMFTLLEPDDEAQSAYDWRILNANTMELVRQESRSGGNYVGATLSRDFNWDELVDNSSIPKVGVRSHGRGFAPPEAPAAQTPQPAPRRTFIGVARNDAQTGPYVESETNLIFVDRPEPWSAEIVGRTVRVTGETYSQPFVQGGEQIPAERMRNIEFHAVEPNDEDC